jgi:hypothetical protein
MKAQLYFPHPITASTEVYRPYSLSRYNNAGKETTEGASYGRRIDGAGL